MILSELFLFWHWFFLRLRHRQSHFVEATGVFPIIMYTNIVWISYKISIVVNENFDKSSVFFDETTITATVNVC